MAWMAGPHVPQLGLRSRMHTFHRPLTSTLAMVRQQQRWLSGEVMKGSTDLGIKLGS